MATLQYGGLIEQVSSTATAGGTTILTNTSRQVQVFTGSLAQTVRLPATNAFNEAGAKFEIYNKSTGNLTIQDSSSSTIATVFAGMSMVFKSNTPTASPGTWAGLAGSQTGVVPIAGGGTGQSTKTAAFDALQPMTTSGDVILGGASGTGTRLAKGADGTFLGVTGGVVGYYNPPTAPNTPTIQKFFSTGTTTGYLFTISTSTTCAVNDTYTNNGHTYTVLAALAAQSGQVLFMSGALAPTSSGTLTRTSGSGTASITFSSNVPLATYTTPATTRWIRVRMAGGGGGGGGGGSTLGGTGSSGTTSAFGAFILKANGGGGGGGFNQGGGAGGDFLVLSPAIGYGFNGSTGSPGVGATTASVGGSGGGSVLAGAGGGGATATAGSAAAGNSGSGGGGGGAQTGSASNGGGCGGGGGGLVDVIIASPNATYVYCVGVPGAHGTAGTGGGTGGDGGDGYLQVEEYY